MKTLASIFKPMMFTALLLLAVSMNAQNTYNPSGTWDYEVETPEGTVTGEMIVKLVEGKYEVLIKSDVYGDMTMEDISFEKMVMEGTISVDGQSMDLALEFDGDDMEGTVYAGEDELTITAERQKKN